MRDDERFEIERAFDLLPHVAGASWATLWFRLHKIKNPTVEEFRQKTAEYFEKLQELYESFPKEQQFEEINGFIKRRRDEETRKILQGENPEIEKRYNRYIDYG